MITESLWWGDTHYVIEGREVSRYEFLLHTEQAAIWAREAVENAKPRDEQVTR